MSAQTRAAIAMDLSCIPPVERELLFFYSNLLACELSLPIIVNAI